MAANTGYENYKTRMEKFPCAFPFVGTDKLTTAKLRTIQHNVEYELDINDNCDNEQIINPLTHVQFRLAKRDETVQLSDEAADSTERRNIASFGNRFFAMQQTGNGFEAMKGLKDLDPLTGHIMSPSAYEQAELHCLKLSQIEGNDDYQEMAKNKLTEAVSMAAELARIMPELQGSHKYLSVAPLLPETDKEQVHYNRQIKQKIKVLELAREYGDNVDVIQKLKDTGHEETALDSYLKLEHPDNALDYHNFVSMNPVVKGSNWGNVNPMRSSRVKILLHAISGRLREISDSPAVLFQQLFELVFGSCFGLSDPENDQQNDMAPVVLGDVLFVFDTHDSPDEEMRCPAVKAARCLKKLSTCLFGLKTEENLKGTGEYGCQYLIQLKEMLKYQVVVIVLGNETSDRHFNAMLETVPYNEEAPPNQKILVIDAGQPGGKIPKCLRQFKSLKLEDTGILGRLQTAPESWGDIEDIPFMDIIKHVGVDAVLKFVCFMID